MDIGSILLILALAVLVGFFVSQPLNRPASANPETVRLTNEEERRLSALQAERERLLNLLSELDSDYSLGKIPQEDYPSQRASLLQMGASVLRQLDELKSRVVVFSTVESPNASTDKLLCPNCGASLHPGDLFCSHCGQAINQE
jgi:hypothetical protein